MGKVLEFKRKKEDKTEPMLKVDHEKGIIVGTGVPRDENLEDRIKRIRHSIERINSLMAELKKQSKGVKNEY